MCQSTLIQCGQSLDGIIMVTINYDRENVIHSSSSEHKRKSDSKDEKWILQELNETSKVFRGVPGRAHACKKLSDIEPNIATKVKLLQWLSEEEKR